MSVEMPLGTPYEDTLALVLEMEEYAEREIKGIKNIVATAGDSGAVSFDTQGSYKGELVIRLDLDDKNADSSESVMQQLRAHWADFPNAVFAFSDDMADMFGGSDIDVVLHIDDVHEGYTDANDIVRLIGDNIASVADLAIDMNAGLPEVSVRIDRQRAYNFGLNVAGIASEIAASMNGVSATTLRYEGEQYDVVLMLQEADRKKIPDLDQIFVRAASGLLLPVSNFAGIDKGTGPVEISREDQSRVIHITGNVVDGYNLSDAEKEVKALLADTDYEVTYAGESAETQSMVNAFIMVLIMALLLVFGVMAGQYESFKDPIINFCTIPLMLIGVVAIHVITGQAVSAFTMMGFVMLAGIVVNNGIILVDYTNLLVHRDGRSVMDACLEAGETRLRPVLMTALTTILGVVPMAFFPGASATMTQPIGLAIIGGLTSATFITLFFIPVMYSIVKWEKAGKRRKSMKRYNATLDLHKIRIPRKITPLWLEKRTGIHEITACVCQNPYYPLYTFACVTGAGDCRTGAFFVQAFPQHSVRSRPAHAACCAVCVSSDSWARGHLLRAVRRVCGHCRRITFAVG
jgi:HAE1 family hydrophobic/amphiphilic exporter-1